MTAPPNSFMTDCAKVAAAQWPWVAQSLHESIANIGHPVGMGVAPNAASTERAAKMICEFIACRVEELCLASGNAKARDEQ